MKIQTFSIVCGSMACNASCPFCVAKMTYNPGMKTKEPEVNWRNFDVAARLADKAGATTAMLTSKGEPTLFPSQVTQFLEKLQDYNFPLVEIQTNGLLLQKKKEKYAPILQEWYEKGLTTVAISVVHHDAEKNRQIYTPMSTYIDLPVLINDLHDIGYSVRLTTILVDGYIDTPSELEDMINFAKEHSVEQLTATPVQKPQDTHDQGVSEWTAAHYLSDEKFDAIKNHVTENGTELMHLAHGAGVYDLGGQNLCLNNCLTVHPDKERMRQLIFYPNGRLTYDWQHEGAVILGGTKPKNVERKLSLYGGKK